MKSMSQENVKHLAKLYGDAHPSAKQASIADALGVHRATLNQILRGNYRGNSNKELLGGISLKTGIHISDLLSSPAVFAAKYSAWSDVKAAMTTPKSHADGHGPAIPSAIPAVGANSQIGAGSRRQTDRNPIPTDCDSNCRLWHGAVAATSEPKLIVAQQSISSSLVGDYKLWMRFEEAGSAIDDYYVLEIYTCRGCEKNGVSPSVLFRVKEYPYAKPHHPGRGVAMVFNGSVHFNIVEPARQMVFIFGRTPSSSRPRPGIFTLADGDGVIAEKCLLVEQSSEADKLMLERPSIIRALIDNDPNTVDGWLRASRDWIKE
jgi:hypothetical protein